MIDPGLILQLKSGHGSIYTIVIGDTEFVYRPLSIKETKQIDLHCQYNDLDEMDREEIYIASAVLWPQDFNLNKMKPGHVSTLASSIADVSGTGNYDVILNFLAEERKAMEEDVLLKMKAWIITAMPYWTEEALDELTMKEFIRNVVLAEEILTIKQEVNGIQSQGVKLHVYSQEEGPQPEQSKPQGKQPQHAVDKEELLRRIRKDNKEDANPFKVTQAPHGMEDFDEELLVKAAGVIRPDDPIAQKLRGSMGVF